MMNEPLMPDGYKSLHEILSRPTTRKDGIAIVDAQPLLLLLEITKEMWLAIWRSHFQWIENNMDEKINKSPFWDVIQKFRNWK